MPSSDEQANLLAIYLDRLIADSHMAGLTSLRDPAAIQRRHFGESLALLDALDAARVFASPAIDIGSGAGFPGLPIKITRPDLALTLLEATGKKADFLRSLVADLGLTRVDVLQARAEDAARDPQHRAAYRLALARAVAPLPVLVELALPFLQIRGILATPKGSGARPEIAAAASALAACGGEVELVQPLPVPGPGPQPTLVLVRKVRETPDRYPRRPGIPSKRPL